jgi:aspartokinase
MALDRDEIIQVIAKDFGILLTKDDPVLAVLAVHDVVLRHYTAEVTTSMEQLKEHLELVTDRYQSHTKALSEALVGKAVKQISEESQYLQTKLKTLLEQEHQRHQTILEELTARSELANKQAKIAMWIAVGFAGLASLAAIAAII